MFAHKMVKMLNLRLKNITGVWMAVMRSIQLLFFISLSQYFNSYTFITFPVNPFQYRFIPGLSFHYLYVKLAFLRNVYLFLEADSKLICHNSDASLLYKKGCCSINKRFSTDSFLNCWGYPWVFTRLLISHKHLLFRLQHRTH